MHEFMYMQNGKSQRINDTVRRSPIDSHGSHGNSRQRQLSGIKSVKLQIANRNAPRAEWIPIIL